MTSVMWDGPHSYPPVGKIAVTRGGSRIEIWPNESEPDCFTGLLLADGRSAVERTVFDLSCMWDRFAIDRIEEPSALDIALLRYEGARR